MRVNLNTHLAIAGAASIHPAMQQASRNGTAGMPEAGERGGAPRTSMRTVEILPPGLQDSTVGDDARELALDRARDERLKAISGKLRAREAHDIVRDANAVHVDREVWSSISSLTEGFRARYDVNTYLLSSTFQEQSTTQAIAGSQADAMKVASKRAEELSKERREKLSEERQLRADEANKARKAGVLGAVLDWVMPIVDVVFGAAKLVAGLVTFNPSLIAGGVLNIAAGGAGLAGAMVNTLASSGLMDRERANRVAAAMSYAQTALSVAAAAVDITSAVRNSLVNGVLGRAADAAKTVMKNSAKSAKKVARSSVIAGRETMGDLAFEVSKKVVQRSGASGIDAARAGGATAISQISRAAGQRVGAGVRQTLTQVLNNDASRFAKLFNASGTHTKTIEKTVEKTVREALTKAAATGGLDALDVRALSTQVAGAVRSSVTNVARWNHMLHAVNALRQTVTGANAITRGVLSKQSADLRYDADILGLSIQDLDKRQSDLRSDATALLGEHRRLSDAHQKSMQDAQSAIQIRNRARIDIANAFA